MSIYVISSAASSNCAYGELMKFAVSLILATLTALSVSAQEAVDSVPLPPQSSRVWAEYGLATLEVGYEKNHSAPVYRNILIGVIGYRAF